MSGMVSSGAFARNDTGRGAKQSRKTGSISAWGGFTAKITGAPPGTCSQPTISMRRKKIFATSRMKAVIALRIDRFAHPRHRRGDPDQAADHDGHRNDEKGVLERAPIRQPADEGRR